MAEQQSIESASTSEPSGASSESVVELNIKTLDSQIYSFHVDQNMPVSLFKEKIADVIGVPVGQQRLIFRGKVLKDDHLLSEYHVENGHTLHLVERQPAQSQPFTGTASGETTSNNGVQANDGNTGGPRSRVGQVSHSVVLGTFNVGDQGDAAGPDISRVIGAVLNSLGVGNLATGNAAVGQNPTPSNPSGQQPPQGTEAGAMHGNAGTQSQEGNRTQSGHSFSGPQFQLPLAGASIPLPSLHTPIPDSLNTLSVFMNRMERSLSRSGYQSNQSPTEFGDQPVAPLPANSRGLPTPEALSIVLRHAERLVSSSVVTMLSHIAGRLEQEAGTTDPSIRSQILTESVQAGLVMQHLGALFLELGRTVLALRMGQSPAESGINAGPAVYISPSGPNPIMVQPFPLQTSSLFNTAGPTNMGTTAPVGFIGNAPRHVNIHIHAGTSLSPLVSAVGARPSTAEGAQGERTGVTGTGDSAPTRVFPARNVIAAAIPARPSAFAAPPISTAPQPVIGVSNSQAADSASLTSVISEVNSHIRNLVDNMGAENQTSGSTAQNFSIGSEREGVVSRSVHAESALEESGSKLSQQAQRNLPHSNQSSSNDSLNSRDESFPVEGSSSFLNQELSNEPEKIQHGDKPGCTRDVPLGLGLGGLQPKKRSKLSKVTSKLGEGGTSSDPPSQTQQPRVSGDQIAQSLQSFGSAVGRNASGPAARPMPPSMAQVMAGLQPVRQSSDGQLDMAGMMSQFVQSPGLGNMLQQFTQNPNAMNAVAQLAQQLNTDDLPMFGGLGSGQGGGVDLSAMVQQMIPIVSQALGGGSAPNEPFSAMRLTGLANTTSGPVGQEGSLDHSSQLSSPRDIFRTIIQDAMEQYHIEGDPDALVNELCNNEELANEFAEVFRRDLHHMLQRGPGFGGHI